MTNVSWLDFNDAADQADMTNHHAQLDAQDIKQQLIQRLPEMLSDLFPKGKARNQQFFIGDLQGNSGKSLVIELGGPKAGMWIDFATDEQGDAFDLWAGVKGQDAKRDFGQIVRDVADRLGHKLPSEHDDIPRKQNQPVLDELGSPTGKWDYTDGQGQLIACVYRYDTPEGKQYRPWDVKARKTQAPDPRPLYNQQQLATVTDVILVEGEKSADALIGQGIAATTAMNGSHAPIDKTDWSPLANKNILIWPDKDSAGWAYAQKVGKALAKQKVASVTILEPPEGKPQKWDAADAVEEGVDIKDFLKNARYERIKTQSEDELPAHSVETMLADSSPMPEDLIAPRVLTPGGVLVFGGAPKVGKSDFVLSWLVHMAAGEPFLGMTPSRPLKVFYLQAEIQYHYLRERLQMMNLPPETLALGAANIFVTPQVQLVLDEMGVHKAIAAIRRVFPNTSPDIIVIDPIRNVFDGGADGGENSNDAMMAFLKDRVMKLRNGVNVDAGVILVHHTKKMNKKQFDEEPFNAFSGASSLRGYYSSGMLLYRPDETVSDRKLKFELRNGPALADKMVDKSAGRWVELDPASDRLINRGYGEKLDAERRRKQDVILQLIYDEALQGRVYTSNQFAETFEGQAGLGGHRTINERLAVNATQGNIKFFRNSDEYDLPTLNRSKYGYMCIEGLVLPGPDQVDTDSGEIKETQFEVKPTHYKCAQTGAVLPVENSDVWVYPDEELT